MRLNLGGAIFTLLLSVSCVPAKSPAPKDQNSADNGKGSSQGARQAATQPSATTTNSETPSSGTSDENQSANSGFIPSAPNNPNLPPLISNPLPQAPVPNPPSTGGNEGIPAPTQTATPTVVPTVSAPVNPDYFVFGYDSISGLYNVYLGCLTCSSLIPDSVFNRYGSYGSAYSSTSINNQYSKWGSVYSSVSACNQIAFNPPAIVDSAGKIAGYWTLNAAKLGRINLDSLNSALSALCKE